MYPQQPYGAPPGMGHPQMGHPQMGHPQMGHPQMGHPQMSMGAPPFAAGQGFMPQHYVPPPSLKDWFDSVDLDRSGTITAPELQLALQRGNLSLSLQSTMKILSLFDRDGNGAVTFDEFQNLHAFVQGMAVQFRRTDTSGDGRLNGQEVRAALRAGGFAVQEGTFQILMRKFDTNRQGCLFFEDYVALCSFLTAVRNTFAFYDKQRCGQVTFNFDSFLAASVTIK